MAFETKEDLQRVCEAVIGYQKGLEEIDKYIGRLNHAMEELSNKAAESNALATFQRYSGQLESLREEAEKIRTLVQELQDGENGLVTQFKILGRFHHAVMDFEDTMKEFNQRVDSLTQKLYNKDFNNAVKAMNAMAEETRQSATYEYHHTTDHDYDILMHEYELSLKNCQQQRAVLHLLAGVRDALCDTSLKRSEHESLQRLIEKMTHSDSKSLQRFLDEIDAPKS